MRLIIGEAFSCTLGHDGQEIDGKRNEFEDAAHFPDATMASFDVERLSRGFALFAMRLHRPLNVSGFPNAAHWRASIQSST